MKVILTVMNNAALYQLSWKANWELVIMLAPNKPMNWWIIRTSIAEVMGSNPVDAWTYFKLYFHYCSLQVVFITANIAFIFMSLSAVHMYDFHTFTVI